ncbi:ankyrin repeat-containing domain protein [Podospora fimiseda]|uniref:Ankyrin repeat-containing domain protein n=1 Tax=Podospora fimiseda TaxID=252190 RepID=A0AAN7BLD0_9PEZI|nr:ankyrin repeat-containing domain protein [Podospora fimiseda]
MKKEQSVCVSEERYRYPFFAALANEDKSAIAALLGLSSTVYNGVVITEGLKNSNDYQNMTPLSWAAQQGNLAMVTLLLQGGAELNEADLTGHTPLIWASENGHDAIAQLLVNRGADVNAQDKKLIDGTQLGLEIS